MPFPHSTKLLTLALAGTTILMSGASCSSAEKSPPAETASSAATPQPAATPAPDTPATTLADTSTSRPAPVTKASVSPTSKRRVSAPRPTTSAQPAMAHPAPAGDSTAAAPEAAANSAQEKWLSYDAGTKTVTFELVAGPFTFNGFRNGGGTLVVPPNANVVMNFINKDGTPHSAIVISGDGPIPNSATDPAIERAYTNKVLEGLPQEGTDVMRFPVPASGTYRIFCGVPGHGLSGMWIWMKIDPAAKAPSFGATKA